MHCARLCAMPIVPTLLEGAPPTLLFMPPGGEASLPMIVLGHGAHLSKDDPVMQLLAKGLCRNVPAAVALMDCPGHGARRSPEVGDDVFEKDIARRMADPANYAQVRDDWLEVERAARATDGRITGPTGDDSRSQAHGSVDGHARRPPGRGNGASRAVSPTHTRDDRVARYGTRIRRVRAAAWSSAPRTPCR
jgi:hypothetical protein